uniref:Protein-PII uridylyltransferase N-terminal domain-containing protein n=1 Tax=Branchiostoma floridae TaxID=7739 RepID=C4A0S9_BRAFL|eukprot:XP_002585592.1 hypothetical protein BRAFLDRAFT_111776 [Branchiostoma floridae]
MQEEKAIQEIIRTSSLYKNVNKNVKSATISYFSPDSTAQHYQREVEPLCKLGDVYSKRGQQTGDGGDFVKAAALYNAAIARSKDEVVNGKKVTAVKKVEKSFLKCTLGVNGKLSQDNTKEHKKQLKEMRDQIKLKMETIDQQLDPYVHDEDDPRVKEIEAKRAKAVRQLFEKIAQQRKEFISQLVEECIGLMGPPPCKYALIGLGSQATGLVTPYSDLEFAILVEEESEQCLEYFCKLTHYLHLKVVNLGETILPALGIKSLNDFYSENPLDNWYYDSVTPRGFAFDGSMPKASKTPLGRQGTRNDPPRELICTPSNMVSKLQTDVTLYLKEGYHLGSILRNPCLITGDQDLIDTFKRAAAKILQEDGGKMAQQLAQETLKENINRNSLNETITASLVDVKKEIYRFPAVAVDCLALSSCIEPTTIWKTIEDMENQKVISPNNAHHLTVLTSISAELRLRTYIANGGQKENLSALASMETIAHVHGQDSALETDEVQTTSTMREFHVQNEKQLFRYYYTAVPLRITLSKWPREKGVLHLYSDLYDASPRVQGGMYHELCKYTLAIHSLNEALKEAGDTAIEKMHLFKELGDVWRKVGDFKTARSYLERALQMETSLYGGKSPTLRYTTNKLGLTWHKLGDNKMAIRYFEQALQMFDHGEAQAYMVLNNLGLAWQYLADFRQAIEYYQQGLKKCRNLYGQAHSEIAILLNNLGETYHHMGDYSQAINYHEQALRMKKNIYGHNSAYPDIAISLDDLGGAWCSLGDYKKAIWYHEQALQMYRRIHGQSAEHPEIAVTISNIGGVWEARGDHRKAISHFEEALKMLRGIFGQNAENPDIAILLNNLGNNYSALGNHRGAIIYLERALHMCRRLYGESAVHPQIATSLNNLAELWRRLGSHRKALSYNEKALEMRKSIYGHTHYYIAESLNNVGVTWIALGDYRKAKSYLKKALEMFRSIGYSSAHPKINDLEKTLALMNSMHLILSI